MKPFLLLCFSLTLSLATQAQVFVKTKPRQPAKVVHRPAAQKANHIWIDGHWKYNEKHAKYIWVDGHWMKENKGHNWVPGHWQEKNSGFVWVPGHWKKHAIHRGHHPKHKHPH